MSTIKPAYLLLKELSVDSLDLIEAYLNGIDISEFSVKEMTLLAPILIEIYEATYSNLPRDVRDPLQFRVNTTAMALISDCISELEYVRDRPELTSKTSYITTMRVLNKLHKMANSLSKTTADSQLSVELTPEDLNNLGLGEEVHNEN